MKAMTRRMTKAEAQAWKARFEALNDYEREELRNTGLEVKLRQLTELMQWVRTFGWQERLAEGENEVRDRWIRLKKPYSV
jgi:hypothetical protein